MRLKWKRKRVNGEYTYVCTNDPRFVILCDEKIRPSYYTYVFQGRQFEVLYDAMHAAQYAEFVQVVDGYLKKRLSIEVADRVSCEIRNLGS